MQIDGSEARSSRPWRRGLGIGVVLGVTVAGATVFALRSGALDAALVAQVGRGGASPATAAARAAQPAVDSQGLTSPSLAAANESPFGGGLASVPVVSADAPEVSEAASGGVSVDQPAASPTTQLAATSSPSMPTTGAPTSGSYPCDVRPTVSADDLDPFYAQICVVGGIPIVGSAAVDSRALVAAAGIINAMLAPRPDLRAQLVAHQMRVGVLGVRQKAVDLPEYRDLPAKYPNTDWSAARAYSATPARPLMSGPEENLVCSAVDTYPGQQVLVHEMGHSVMDLAVRYLDPAFWGRVQQAYEQAMASGRWVGYYGGSSATEYWAEGVQAYFNASRATSAPDPLGTPVDTREKLAAYDPALTSLIRQVFTDNPWRASCP